jgi:hypothetical protein
MKEFTFGSLLKRYRKRAGFRTLSNFADALADEGLVYSESVLSRWQKDSRLPKDRMVFIIIIRVLIAYGAISNIYQANKLLSSAGQGFLSSDEVSELLSRDELELNMSLYQENTNIEEDEKLVKIALILPRNMNKYLDWVSDQYETSKAEVFRKLINQEIKSKV